MFDKYWIWEVKEPIPTCGLVRGGSGDGGGSGDDGGSNSDGGSYRVVVVIGWW